MRENGCYRGGQRENSHVTEMVSLMEGEWSLQRWPVYLTFKSPHLHLHQNMRGERKDFMPAKREKISSCYRGCHFNGRENGHVTEVITLMEGKWSGYRGGQFI